MEQPGNHAHLIPLNPQPIVSLNFLHVKKYLQPLPLMTVIHNLVAMDAYIPIQNAIPFKMIVLSTL